MTRRRVVPVLTAAAVVLGAPAVAQAQLRLHRCDEGRCGTLSVPLDRSGTVPGRISLNVHRALAYRPPRRGVTLLLAGGPGQAGVAALDPDHVAFNGDLTTWRGLMPRNDIVAFDQRGTGRSGLLRCRDLEAATSSDTGREAAACATLLGPRRGFYRTSDTVEDIEALREALGVERLTIAGVSYGTYVAQRYALRFPERVERLVLDSVVDAAGVDPLYLDSMAAVRRVLPELCRFDCRSFTSDPLEDTRRLTEQLGRARLRGTIVGPTGHRRTAFLSRQELLFTLVAGDLNPILRADYPAAVVSALRGDTAPILRLKRNAMAIESAGDPHLLSSAVLAATLCEETRFPWSWQATPAERDEAAYRSETQLAPALAAPFDPGTLVRNDLMRLCRRWPTASPGPPSEPGAMPDVPVLLLAGADDLRTPVEEARRAAERFPQARLLDVPGVAHSVQAHFDGCAERAVERFLAGRAVQERCPRARPLFEPTAPLPDSLADVARARGVPGKPGRVLAAVGLTLTDLYDEFFNRIFGDLATTLGADALRVRGAGLRGGSFVVTDDALRVEKFEFVPGVRLSGRASGDERLVFRLRVAGRVHGRLTISETDGDGEGDELSVRVRGRLGGGSVDARLGLRVRFLEALGFRGSSAGLVAAAARLVPARLR